MAFLRLSSWEKMLHFILQFTQDQQRLTFNKCPNTPSTNHLVDLFYSKKIAFSSERYFMGKWLHSIS